MSSYYHDPDSPFFDIEQNRWKDEGNTHVKIYQFKDDIFDDPEGHAMRFWHKIRMMTDFENLPQELQDAWTMDWYELVWEGNLEADNDPWHVFEMLQDYRPMSASMAMYSLSDGDIIEIDGKKMMVNPHKMHDINKMKKMDYYIGDRYNGEERTFTPGSDDQYYPVEVFIPEKQEEKVKSILSQNGYDLNVYASYDKYIKVSIGSTSTKDEGELQQTSEQLQALFSQYYNDITIERRENNYGYDYMDDYRLVPPKFYTLVLRNPKEMDVINTLGGRVPLEYSASVHKSHDWTEPERFGSDSPTESIIISFKEEEYNGINYRLSASKTVDDMTDNVLSYQFKVKNNDTQMFVDEGEASSFEEAKQKAEDAMKVSKSFNSLVKAQRAKR